MSRDLTAEPDEILGSVLEPLPVGVERFRSSLSEELYKAATWGSSVDLTRFGDHRDTFAILDLRKLQDRRLTLPEAFWQGLVQYLDYETYLAVRLSCRCWSAAISRSRPIRLPTVSMLPAEILENIYTRLYPMDFNAARHTCREWMITSLDEKLLSDMLKRGGWWAAAQADMELQEARGGIRSPDTVSQEWLLSKRLATECSLRPDWTGNGLSRSPWNSPDVQSTPSTSLVLTSKTDFSELRNGYIPMVDSQTGVAVHFNVSICNKFLLVTEGCVIYIYSLRDESSISHKLGGHLAPLATVICPHRILAVSMDTSSNRFAIAALLEGRVGFVCDFHEHETRTRRRSGPRELTSTSCGSRPSVYSSSSSGRRIVTECNTPHVCGTSLRQITYYHGSNLSDRALARAVAESTLPEIRGARSVRTSWTMDDPLLTTLSPTLDPSPPISNNPYMFIESGPRSIYRNLCSAEDPPRSVAICPQRRCVAFGCTAGIELHWIDALTGQDLNRWFPLTAPSDFLYFLPPRPGVDSAKKLRLISSACHPKGKDGLQCRHFASHSEARHGGMSWDEGLSDPGGWDHTRRGGASCNHYQAVPVSDGWNILFTDPEAGHLCLGSDAPPGTGATKLARRYMFEGPEDLEGKPVVPRVYKSGGELRWGGRIVVGYGDALWLFVVPPAGFLGDDKKGEGEPSYESSETGEVSPVRVRGVQIGKVPGLVDMAVDATGGDLTVWAFAIDGLAFVWQLDDGCRAIIKRIALRDGTVSSAENADGDTFMHGADIPSPTSRRAVQLDGAASLRRPIPASALDYGTHDHIIDKDGDVAMPDAPPSSDEVDDQGYVSDAEEFELAGGVFAIHAPPLWGRWSEESADWVPDYLAVHGEEIEDEGLVVDLMEMARCEVEFRGL